MGRPCKWPPTIQKDRSQNRERVRVYENGKTIWKDLGPIGSEAAKREYARLIAEAAVLVQCHPSIDRKATLTVNELFAAYLAFAQGYYDYRELWNIKRAFRLLLAMYAGRKVADFGPLALKAVRSRFVKDGLARKTCNRFTDNIRRAWKWGVVEQLVEVALYDTLMAVESLKVNKTEAPDHPAIGDAPPVIVAAAIPFLLPVVGDMVRVQRLCAMRPGELVVMRPMDVRRPGVQSDGQWVWEYVPEWDKKRHLGKFRRIPVPPPAQELLAKYLRRAEAAYCFSPREALERYRGERGQKFRFGKSRLPGKRYQVGSYCHTVYKACLKAFPLSPHLARRHRESHAAWMERLGEDGQAERSRCTCSPFLIDVGNGVDARPRTKTRSAPTSRIRAGHATAIVSAALGGADAPHAGWGALVPVAFEQFVDGGPGPLVQVFDSEGAP
jgi:integrase